MAETPSSSAPSAPAAPAAPTPTAKSAAPAVTKAPVTPSASRAPANAAPASAGVPDSKHAEVAAAPTETVAERKARKLQLKIDGKMSEVDIDAMSDDKLAVELQLGAVARKRMQESAELNKKFESIIEYISENPWEALKDPVFNKGKGVNLEELAEKRLAERYQQELMPEQEREQHKLRQELEGYKKKESEFIAQKRAEAQQAMEQRVFEETEQSFIAALESSDLPKNKRTLAMMAQVQMLNLEHGIELTPSQIASEVREQLSGHNQEVLRSMKGESLLSYLGEETVKEVLRLSVAKVRGPSPAKAKPADAAAAPANDDSKPPMDPKQFRKWMRGY